MSERNLSLADWLLGGSVILGFPVAFYFLRSLNLEWAMVTVASFAMARAVGGDHYDRTWKKWGRMYFTAAGIALFLYSIAAAGDQGLFGVIFRPAHFHQGLKVGAAALLSMWAGIGAAHVSHDPEWVKEKERRRMEAEGVAVINAGGRWIVHGREMTVFEGRLLPKVREGPNKPDPINDERLATAVHESGHAVVSYLLGLPIMRVDLWTMHTGEVIPECFSCGTCNEYYESCANPKDAHLLRIQERLRFEAAIAVAGEIAEIVHFGKEHEVNADELALDRRIAKERAGSIHLFRRWCEGTPCSECDSYLESLRGAITQIIGQPDVHSAIAALANRLTEKNRLMGCEVEKFLGEIGLKAEPEEAKKSIPAAPIEK